MGKTFLRFFIFGLFLLLLSCEQDKTIKREDDCGKHLFSVLKDFDTEEEEKFAKSFISLETIHKMGNDLSMIKNKQRKERFRTMSEAYYEKHITGFAYKLLQEEGGSYNIDWKKIKYVGFVHEPQKYASMQSIKGKLVFSYGEEKYDVAAVYVKAYEGWQLAAISGLFIHGIFDVEHNIFEDSTFFI